MGLPSLRRDTKGASAVEFAIVAPIFLLLVFGVFAACEITATLNGLEQLAAGAARATVAGLSDAERTSLATGYVGTNVSSYPYISGRSLSVTTAGNASAKTFTVVLTYDVSRDGVLGTARSLFPTLPSSLSRSSVAIEGGQ